MANMSYCRFENTAKDMQDCVYNWNEAKEDGEELSSYEKRGKETIVALAKEIIALAETEDECPECGHNQNECECK